MNERNEHRKDFDNLITAFIEIGNKLVGIKIAKDSEFLYHAEGLGKKLINHIVTVRVLSNGYKFGAFEATIDFGSIAVLARAALETYLTFNYLFVSPNDDDEKIFKLNVWYLGGLDRIKYKPAFADNLHKYEEEIERASRLKDIIRNTKYFSTLHDQRQKQALKGVWKLDEWAALAKKAGFSDEFFRKQYMFLSSYAHSNNLSVFQTQQINDLDGKRAMAESFIIAPMVVLGKYAFDYVQIMPGLKETVNFDSPQFKILNTYKFIGENLK